MSVVCILTPVVIAGWPAFSAAVAAAATSLGYAVVEAAGSDRRTKADQPTVQLEIANSEVVTGTLGREQQISVRRDGVTVTFSRDARGRAALCVTGAGVHCGIFDRTARVAGVGTKDVGATRVGFTGIAARAGHKGKKQAGNRNGGD